MLQVLQTDVYYEYDDDVRKLPSDENYDIEKSLKNSNKLKGQTDGKLNFDWYMPLGDTCYVFRISKYIILMKK